MKITKQKLKEIIREELARERIKDDFNKLFIRLGAARGGLSVIPPEGAEAGLSLAEPEKEAGLSLTEIRVETIT